MFRLQRLNRVEILVAMGCSQKANTTVTQPVLKCGHSEQVLTHLLSDMALGNILHEESLYYIMYICLYFLTLFIFAIGFV